MVQKAKKIQNTADRLKSLNNHKSTLYALNRFKDSPVTSGTAFFANNGGSAGGSTSAAGNFLRTEGDTMVGPIAFYPVTVGINASDELDISPTPNNPQSSSYVIVSFSSPDTLQLIKGAQFAGQQLWVQVPAASTLTIEDYSSNATGNIVTSDQTDLVITTTTDPVTFTMLFDVTLGPNGNNGAWVVLNAKAVTGATGGGSFATKALDNLVSPTLNTFINFNSHAPTNFSGYVSPIAGNTLANTAGGTTWTLPAGDVYDFQIAGTSIFTISAAGLATAAGNAGNINVSDSYITLDDISTPADPGTGARRIFVDTASGELSVRTAGGSTVSLEASGGTVDKIIEGDSSVEVVDAGTGSIVFVADTVSQGTITDGAGWSIDNDVSINSTNTLTVGGTTTLNGNVVLGNADTDDITGSGEFARDIVSNTDITYNLGSTSKYWAGTFSSTYNIGNSGASANYGLIRGDSNGVEIRTNNASDTIDLQTNGANSRFEVGDSTAVFKSSVTLEINNTMLVDGGNVIKANDSVECGFQVTDDSISLGAAGTIQIPFKNGSSSTAAQADTDFGDSTGCIGIYTNDTSNVHLLVSRQVSGNWAGVILTDNTLV